MGLLGHIVYTPRDFVVSRAAFERWIWRDKPGNEINYGLVERVENSLSYNIIVKVIVRTCCL